jgi:hypothetical protein
MSFRSYVSYSDEFRRIENIPRREWDIEPNISMACSILKEHLKTLDGHMDLWKLQVAALEEICFNRGAFLPIGVGLGKSLISLLAASVLEAQRPVLFVPAELRDQTRDYVLRKMSVHWQVSRNLRVIGYSELSLMKNMDMLEIIKPDLIILDECHYLKNRRAGRTRRISRYFKEYPETMCVAMSGTVCSKSLLDYAHIVEWCLKKNSPVPIVWNDLMSWANCLDENVLAENRVDAGALLKICKDNESPRQGFRRRLVESPGVIASNENDLGVSLRIRKWDIKVPAKVQKILEKVRATWETPSGDIIS